MSRWSEMTAAYGGTFDPPHLGHREAVLGLFRTPGIARVIVLPSADPPHKVARTEAVHRVALAKLAFDGIDHVSIDDREVARARRTGLPSYTFDTLQELGREHPRLAFVIGADQVESLPTWNKFPVILRLSNWIVLARKPDGEAIIGRALTQMAASGLVNPIAAGSEFGEWEITGSTRRLIVVPTEAPDLSSSRIREQIARSGEPPEGSLSPKVALYLKQNGLYGTSKVQQNSGN